MAYFHKQKTTQVFLRDATEIPLYALLLLGGAVSIDRVAGGVTIDNKDSVVNLKASSTIGILVNQLRRLLDAQLERCIEDGSILLTEHKNPIFDAVLALLAHDGLSE